jgi:hypothetical protein
MALNSEFVDAEVTGKSQKHVMARFRRAIQLGPWVEASHDGIFWSEILLFELRPAARGANPLNPIQD